MLYCDSHRPLGFIYVSSTVAIIPLWAGQRKPNWMWKQVRRKVARKHRRRLLLSARICRFPSNRRTSKSGLGSEGVSNCIWPPQPPRGPLLAWAAALKCSIWLHVFITKHGQRWFHFPETFGGNLRNTCRLKIHPQMEPVSRNPQSLPPHVQGCRLHQTPRLCLIQTLENANAATPDLGYCNKFL